jgi:hypothetical protein
MEKQGAYQPGNKKYLLGRKTQAGTDRKANARKAREGQKRTGVKL